MDNAIVKDINGSGLDELDFNILVLLQQDGRVSFTVMAEQLGASISTIRTRVGKLIEDKTIQIVGRVNPEKVGFHAYAHIKIAVRPANLIEHVSEKLMEFGEVSFLAIISGDYDLEMDVMCRDNNHLLQVVNERIARIEGVYRTKTDMYFKVLKFAQPDLSYLR
ncbi:MAG: Lrp/AsnC family transcriptional regulator [Sphingobacteriaceae bacterium]|nr:MAG: Lrp/AsnC family transcriptional regulator [Sphingobacteriaceae bacterium]